MIRCLHGGESGQQQHRRINAALRHVAECRGSVASAILTLLSVALYTVLSGCAPIESESSPPQERLPNIVLILADDLGYGDVKSNYPEGKIATPNIDQLARAGMRFTDAHSGGATCTPTRYGLLTGRHFSRHPNLHSTGLRILSAGLIEEGRVTLASMLKQRGYHTGAFGKWHLGQTFYDHAGKPTANFVELDTSRRISGGATDHGFDTFFGVPFTQGHYLLAYIDDGYVTAAPEATGDGTLVAAPGLLPVDVMPETTRRALEYIDWNAQTRPGQPFFLYFPAVAIHDPLVPSPEFRGGSGVGLYGDFVTQFDSAVGDIVARLDRYGLRDDTLIIVTSDNGSLGRTGSGPFMKFPARAVTHDYGHRMNGPWRGIKGEKFEGGHRVPFIASWPGHIEAGAVTEELIALEDMLATFAALIDFELPPGSGEDSYNIVPYLDSSHSGPPIRQYTLITPSNRDMTMRHGEWVISFTRTTGRGKAEVAANGGAPLPQGLLYNLHTDPAQRDNLWLERPDVVEELTELYERHVARGSSFGIER